MTTFSVSIYLCIQPTWIAIYDGFCKTVKQQQQQQPLFTPFLL